MAQGDSMFRHFFFFILIFSTSLLQADWEFDTSNEGFETFTIDELRYPAPMVEGHASYWIPTGGNPGGHIEANTTTGLSARLYAVSRHKDANTTHVLDLNNRIVTVDIRRSVGHFQSPSGERLLAYWNIGDTIDNSGNWWISKAAFAIDINAMNEGEWTTHSIEMREENFMPWPFSANTGKHFEELLKDYSFVGITFMSEDNTSWGTYTLVDGTYRLLHFGAVSHDGAILSIDNFRAQSPSTAVPMDRMLVMAALSGVFFLFSLGALSRRRKYR